MKYHVSRQHYYYSGEKLVEIAVGGLDYSGADYLTPKYQGEGEDYENPIEAVDSAIAIMQSWQIDSPDDQIGIAYGCSHGFGAEFEPTLIENVKQWAQEKWESTPKCARCNEPLGDSPYTHDFVDDYVFCSENCANDDYWEYMVGMEE